MKRTIEIIFVILLVSALLPTKAFATLPVIDLGAITQIVNELNQLQRQYKLLDQTYQNAQQQLNKTKEIANDSEGHYGFGNLLNSANDLTNREWSPDNWDSALRGLAGGNPARYQELFSAYEKNHATLSQKEYKKGASKVRAKTYQQEINTNRAAAVNSTYSFNDIKKHMQNVSQLSEKIEQANNTKAATDLNSRLLAEVAYIQIQELKMQTVLNQQLVQQGADRIEDETQAAKFNALPD